MGITKELTTKVVGLESLLLPGSSPAQGSQLLLVTPRPTAGRNTRAARAWLSWFIQALFSVGARLAMTLAADCTPRFLLDFSPVAILGLLRPVENSSHTGAPT